MPLGNKANPSHDVPSTILHRYDVVLMVRCALFAPYIVLSILPKQFNFYFISSQNLFPAELQIATVLFGKLQVRSNDFDGEQRLPPWCSAMDILPVQRLMYGRLMNREVCQFQCDVIKPLAVTSTSWRILHYALGVFLAECPLLGRVATVLNCLHV